MSDTPNQRVRRTIVEVDLVSYSDICAVLEGLHVGTVADLNQQIQDFVDVGLAAIVGTRDECVATTTGDGAILIFESAEAAHTFAAAVHTATQDHNALHTQPLAKRVFRCGIATGDIVENRCGGAIEIAGMTIARAVRLEAQAQPGGLLADQITFDNLSPSQRAKYGTKQQVTGKRDEVFDAHPCQLNPTGPKDAYRLSRNLPTSDVLLLLWRGRPKKILAAIGLFLLLISLVLAWLWFLQERDLPSRLHLNIGLTHGSAPSFLYSGSRFFRPGDFAISPDGEHICYKYEGALRIRSLTSGEIRILAKPALYPFFSPDSKRVAFFADSSLKTISIAGGSDPFEVCPAPSGSMLKGCWLDDDVIIFQHARDSGLVKVNAWGGIPETLTTLRGDEASHRWPSKITGARAILYVVKDKDITSFDDATICVLDLENGESRRLIPGGTAPKYARSHDGKREFLLYARKDSIFSVPFSSQSLTVIVENTIRVLDSVVIYSPTGDAGYDYCTSKGRLVCVRGSSDVFDSFLVRVGANASEQVIAGPGRYDYPIAATETDECTLAAMINAANNYIVTIGSDGVTERISQASNALWPVWRPDGTEIAYTTAEGRLYVTALESPRERRINLPFEPSRASSWSLDSNQILVIEKRGGIWMVDPLSKRDPRRVENNLLGEPRWATLSPDGKWIAFVGRDSGQESPSVFLMPSDGKERPRKISPGRAYGPLWSHDSKRLFYLDGDVVMELEVPSAPPRTRELCRVEGVRRSGFYVPNYTYCRIHDAFVFVRPVAQRDFRELEIVLNWWPETDQ